MQNRKALLIIDMQKGSFESKSSRFDAAGVVKRINELAEWFRNSKLPVIYLQHDGTGTGNFEKNTTEWELLDTLSIDSTDILIDKYANDVFYNSKLQSKLTELKVNELFITGCATDFCVESTVQAALSRDYHITVISDGHTTADRPHLKASKVIEHYNWVWKNMIPTKGTIEVKTFEQAITSIQKRTERKTIYLLLGKKGSGKSFIGTLFEKEFGIRFVRVEDWAKKIKKERAIDDERYLIQVFKEIENGIRASLKEANKLVFESTGLTEYFDQMLFSLKKDFDVTTIGIDADNRICLERIKRRDQTIHINISDDQVLSINEKVRERNHRTDYYIVNETKSESELKNEISLIIGVASKS